MNEYYLCRMDDDRAILQESPDKGDLIQTIQASCWVMARNKVKESMLHKNPGYGWFIR